MKDTDIIVYVLKNKQNIYYTGITADLVKRVIKHNTGTASSSSKRFQPSWSIVHSWTLPTRHQALIFEYYLHKLSGGKSWCGNKSIQPVLNLIKDIPEYGDDLQKCVETIKPLFYIMRPKHKPKGK